MHAGGRGTPVTRGQGAARDDATLASARGWQARKRTSVNFFPLQLKGILPVAADVTGPVIRRHARECNPLRYGAVGKFGGGRDGTGMTEPAGGGRLGTLIGTPPAGNG